MSKHPLATLFKVGLVLAVVMVVLGLALKPAYEYDTNPRGFERFVARTLGISRTYTPGGQSAIGRFGVRYYDERRLDFYVPDEVWAAAVVAGNAHGVDPTLIVATAFSESPVYNNEVTSSAGAQGVWQFTESTWNSLWGDNPPPRTDIPSAADAAARYLKAGEAADAHNQDEFVYAFAEGPRPWNRYEPQAEFVWDLWQKLEGMDQGTETPFVVGSIRASKPWAPLVIWWLNFLGIMPEFKSPGGAVGLHGSASSGNFEVASGLPPFIFPDGMVIGEPVNGWICGEDWVQSQDLHGASYGQMAYDIVCEGGFNAPLFSPLDDAVVTDSFIDGLGNTVLVINNGVYEVTLFHDRFTVDVGDHLEMGDMIGTQANFGNTWTSLGDEDSFCGTGSDCGEHIHINVFDIEEGHNVDPYVLLDQPEPTPEPPPLPPTPVPTQSDYWRSEHER